MPFFLNENFFCFTNYVELYMPITENPENTIKNSLHTLLILLLLMEIILHLLLLGPLINFDLYH